MIKSKTMDRPALSSIAEQDYPGPLDVIAINDDSLHVLHQLFMSCLDCCIAMYIQRKGVASKYKI